MTGRPLICSTDYLHFHCLFVKYLSLFISLQEEDLPDLDSDEQTEDGKLI